MSNFLSHCCRTALITVSLGLSLAAAPAPAAEPVLDGWPTTGNDAGGSRYSRAKTITRANVAKLSPAWTAPSAIAPTP